MTAEFESLLPANVSGAMSAVEQTSGERWDLDVDVIRRFKDPWLCPAHLLNFLAYERSVDLWDEKWPEWKKRSVIASAPQDHRLKGTLAGISRYVEIADGHIVQSLTPPQHFFLAADLTKDQWDEWIDQMPRLRITLGHAEGEWAPPSGIFLDESAFDDDHFALNDGPLLHGRQALLRPYKNAPESVSLKVGTVTTTVTQRAATDYERVSTPGEDANGLILDEGGLDQSYLDGQASDPKVYTYALDRTYNHVESLLSLSMLDAGLEPQSVRYKRESDIGDAEGRLFLDDGAYDEEVTGRNDGGDLLADVLYLLDPQVAAPLVDGVSFLDVSRLGMSPYHAELMIEAPKTLDYGFVLDESVFDVDFAVPDDISHLHFLLDAVALSQALRDKILITFETTKSLTLGDAPRLNSGVRLGDRVPAYL